MFTPTLEGAAAPTVSPAPASATLSHRHVPSTTPATAEPIRHMIFGSLCAVRATINHLHKLRYAEVDDWSQPIPTGRANEVMAILTKKVRIQ